MRLSFLAALFAAQFVMSVGCTQSSDAVPPPGKEVPTPPTKSTLVQESAPRSGANAAPARDGISLVRELDIPLKGSYRLAGRPVAVLTADAAILMVVTEQSTQFDHAEWLVKLPLDGSPAKLIHEFVRGDNDGTNPLSMIVSASGKIFGTLEHGPSNEGGVFSLDANGENYQFLGEFPRPQGESSIGAPKLWTRGPERRVYGHIQQNPSTSLLFYVNDDGSFEVKPHPEPYKHFPYMHSLCAESDGKYLYAATAQELVRMNPDFTGWTTLYKFTGRERPDVGPIFFGPGRLLYGLGRDREDSRFLYCIKPDGTDYRAILKLDFPVHSLVAGPQSAFYALQDVKTTDSQGRRIDGCPNALLKIPVDGSPSQVLSVFAQPEGYNITEQLLIPDENRLYGITNRGGQADRGGLFCYQFSGNSTEQSQPATVTSLVNSPSESPSDKPALPWSNPEDSEHFVFIENEIWDLRSFQKVLTWPHDYKFSPINPRLVRGATDALVDIRRVDREGTFPRLWRLDGSEFRSNTLWSNESHQNSRSYWMAAEFMPDDLRRAIYIDKGDLWRATIDWKEGKLVDAKQVTKLGLLEPGKNKMLHWYGNTAWLWGGFDKDKPVVRVNLLSGDVVEMTSLGVFSSSDREGRTQKNPSGDLLYRAADGLVYVYDIRNNKTLSFPNDRDGRQARFAVQDFPHEKSWNWISDRKLQVMSQEPGTPFLIDWNLGKIVNLAPNSASYYLVEALPGGQFIDVAEQQSVRGRSISPDELPRFLIEIATAKKTPLPVNRGTPSKWLSESELLYVKKEGGLSQVGTWLYNRNTNQHSRITAKQITGSRFLIWNPKTRILCTTLYPDHSLVAINLEKEKPATMTLVGDNKLNGGDPLRQIDSSEIDLGLHEASDPWKLQAELDVNEPQRSGELIGIELVRKQVEDETPELRAYAEKTYEALSKEGQFEANTYDPVKLTLKLVEAYRKKPVDHDDNPLVPLFGGSPGLDIRDCIDKARLEKYFYNRAMSQFALQQMVNGDNAKLKAISEAIAKQGVDLVVKNHPKTGSIGLDKYYSDALKEVTRKLR